MNRRAEGHFFIRGHIAVVLYASFLVFLLFSSFYRGFSNYHAEMAFRSGSESQMISSLEYQPENPDAHEKHGLIRLRDPDFAGAEVAFEKAISLREHDFMLWLRLGYSRQRSNDINGASEAYRRAIEFAPRYSQPQYFMGVMLLEAGLEEEGFTYLSRAAEFDPSISALVRRLARQTYPGNADAIESAVGPMSGNAKKSLARFLIKYHYMTNSVRDFLIGQELTDSEKNDFIKYLLHKKNFELAREVWLSRTDQENRQEIGHMHDGGFEFVNKSDPSGLGWQIDQNMSATAVARDTETAYEGKNSLKIRFAGDAELNRPVLSQLVFVEPGRLYSLSFYVRSAEMISAGPPEVAIFDGRTNERLANSTEIKETRGEWMRREINFTSTDSPVVIFAVQRRACGTSPCPIFGDLSLDDLELLELSPDSR